MPMKQDDYYPVGTQVTPNNMIGIGLWYAFPLGETFTVVPCEWDSHATRVISRIDPINWIPAIPEYFYLVRPVPTKRRGFR
jgi:hypothetical protein